MFGPMTFVEKILTHDFPLFVWATGKSIFKNDLTIFSPCFALEEAFSKLFLNQ
jgi:hypothetical protein